MLGKIYNVVGTEWMRLGKPLHQRCAKNGGGIRVKYSIRTFAVPRNPISRNRKRLSLDEVDGNRVIASLSCASG